MRFKITLPLLLGMAVFSASACAADGYQDMKFGTSTATVLTQANCTMEEPEEAPVGKMYSCEDFTFASNKTEATLFFVNDKFIRIAIAIPDEEVAKTLETLKQKYGVAAHSSQKEMQDVDLYPNKTAFINFDNNHISLLKTSNEDAQSSATLIYSAENIEEIPSHAAP
ncbi:hypothetical protein PUATCC27989T_03183 [Phytobacter ursingii]|uniref:Lipoprotein n=1 Tax=Phytobacter ursingii TaxID=1972431 RepID=A0AB35RK90_9ENTR|nr:MULTISPECIES: hypothetical protein [Enterobacteriaceae]MDV2862026.1 hypothetical protein [Phytobacter ursingii]GJL33479.1 hypothetical protein TUM17576_02990 [Enterobacter hormaechei]VTP15291.1 hypothetical protein PUATCC27989T_03183 [Phytobacter ursingii]